MRKFLLSVTGMFTLIAASNAAEPIKVGEFASLTGKEAAFGQSSHNGTLLAVERLNAEGGVLGRKIDLITEDNQTKAGESVTAARKLISRDKVVAVLGEVASGRSLEAAPICQRYKIPMISPASTNPRVTEMGDYVFRVCFIDPFQGTVMAKFAKNTLKVKRVAVLTDVSAPYSVGLAKFFKERFLADGGTVVAEKSFSGGDKDFKAQLTSLKSANPEGIFLPCYYTEAGLIAVQARQLGITVPLFGGDGWSASQLVPIGGAAVEGAYFSDHFSPDQEGAKAREFVKAYKERFNHLPDGMAALGYDSVMLLVDAIKRVGGTDSAKLRDTLASTKDFEGVTGRITMDAQRNATKSAVILTVANGQFKYVETIAP